ncbi:MAG: PadR family transcriptional regulator [Candidatus Sigynarchaeota archaeon]
MRPPPPFGSDDIPPFGPGEHYHGPGFPGGPPGFCHVNAGMPPRCPGPGAWFGPPGPPGPPGPHHHGGPHPPPPGFQPPWFWPPGPPPLLRREAFQEIKYLFLLMLIADEPKGITGYQLQEKYAIPRGNLVRTLDELEELGYVATREDVKDGRNQKYYTITDKGKQYVERLKEDWASRFSILSEMAPPDLHGNPFRRPRHRQRMLEHVGTLKSKEDALDYFQGFRHSVKRFMDRLEYRIKRVEQTKTMLDSIIKKIESMEKFDVNAIKEFIQNAPQEMDDDVPDENP